MPVDRKRAVLWVAGAWCVVELTAAVTLAIQDGGPGRWWSEGRVAPTRELSTKAETGSDTVLHPYLGFVYDPSRLDAIGELGFASANPPLEPRHGEAWRVALLGGASASALARDGYPRLVEALRAREDWSRREIEVVNLALPGHKQPQGWMTLAYLLTLRAELDAVILVDGLEEVAALSASAASGRKNEVFAAYPVGWSALSGSIPDPRRRRLLGWVEYLESRRQSVEQGHLGSFLRYSPAWVAWGRWRAGRIDPRLAVARAELREVSKGDRATPYAVGGPHFDWTARQEDAFRVAVWARGSLQLARLCQENGIRYLHYFEPLPRATGKDAHVAFERAGESLVAQGILFADLAGEPVLSRNAGQWLAQRIARDLARMPP